MSIPLIMTGPGGDYTTRYDVKGQSLVRQIGATLKQQPDTESGSSFAGYYKSPRKQRKNNGSRLSGGPRGGLPLASVDRLADVFVHHESDEDAYLANGIYRATGVPVVSKAVQAQDQAREVAQQEAGSGTQVRNISPAMPKEAVDAAEMPNMTPAMYQAIQTWLDLHSRALRTLSEQAVALNQAVRACQASKRVRQGLGQGQGKGLGQGLGSQQTAALQNNNHAGLSQASDHEPATAANFASDEPVTTSPVGAAAAKQMLPHTTLTSEVPHGDESDTQAAENSHTDPRPAFDTRLFADHAGTGPRVGRQQGYGLRTRRGSDQKRSPAAPAKQGSLFGG